MGEFEKKQGWIDMHINWTNFTGAIALFWAIHKNVDTGIWAGVILVLGRAALPGIEKIIRAWKGQANG